MVSDGAEFAVGDIERLFEEARRNTELNMKIGRNIIIDAGVMCKSRSGGPERKIQKGSEHRVNKRNLSSNDTNSDLPKYRKKGRREETVTPTTSGYNLRPRIGKREESRPTIQRKAQQGGPVRSRKGRERNDSPHTSRSEQDQATRMPGEEVINNGKTRKEEERGQRNPCHWRLGRKRQLQVI
ncbi:uncharacterized protein TNCV_3876321 [Trichonephila clavipes]|uniref:Uncharacterized protein n=1 Tax=Trichonephila clavipes TaxID=2585209 RepID=A0A8X6SS13_TRICX|nr:uncharacterized protein TNCV_3876321 [Trichonephila clavipes]